MQTQIPPADEVGAPPPSRPRMSEWECDALLRLWVTTCTASDRDGRASDQMDPSRLVDLLEAMRFPLGNIGDGIIHLQRRLMQIVRPILI